MHKLPDATAVQIFVFLVCVLFCASTFSVWLFSQLVFPVFVARYFLPNLIVVSMLTGVTGYVLSTAMPFGIVDRLWCAAGLSLFVLGLKVDRSIADPVPCFEASSHAYIEDGAAEKLPILALSVHTWMTRLARPGENVIFPVDADLDEKLISEDATHKYTYRLITVFANWADRPDAVQPIKTLFAVKKRYLILDDDREPGLKQIPPVEGMHLDSVAQMTRCRLWKTSFAP